MNMVAGRFSFFSMIALSFAIAAPTNADRGSSRLVAVLHQELRKSGQPVPTHVRIASVPAGRAGTVHFVHWIEPSSCGNTGGCGLEIYRQRGRMIASIGFIPIVDNTVTVFPARAGWLPDFMVNRWGAHQVYSRIAFNGWRYHPIWDKPPGAFPGKTLPGRVVISPRTPITTIR